MSDKIVGRTVDTDLKFWGAVAAKIATPKPFFAELRANFYFFLVVIFTLYSVWCVYDRFAGELPSRVSSIEVLGSPAPGEDVGVAVNLIRYRVCERDFEWIVTDVTGHRERFAEAHMHAIGNPGPDNFVQHFQIPIDLKPGPARLRIIWSWQCPQNLYETIYPVSLVLPEIKFIIAAPHQ